MSRFPEAPEGAYVSEEGWLIVGDEAWTEQEWRDRASSRPRRLYIRYSTDTERLLARRRARREHMQRKRAAERLARHAPVILPLLALVACEMAR